MGDAQSKPQAAPDYGKMYDEYGRDHKQLAKQAGIPAAWMTVSKHQPTGREDFVGKMERGYYVDFAAAGVGSTDQLPLCVGKTLAQVISAWMLNKFGKEVSPSAITTAIMGLRSSMLTEGINPLEGIQLCNGAKGDEKGLLVLGDDDVVYFIKIRHTAYAHSDFSRAMTLVSCLARMECPSMVIVVLPDLQIPLHAMVASSVGNSAIRAYNPKPPRAAAEHTYEHDITEDAFHQLILCEIDASEQRPAGRVELNALRQFQQGWESANKTMRKIEDSKNKRKGIMGVCAPSCVRLPCVSSQDAMQQARQLLPSNDKLLRSMREADDAFDALRQEFERFVAYLQRPPSQASFESAAKLGGRLSESIKDLKLDDFKDVTKLAASDERKQKLARELGIDERRIREFVLASSGRLQELGAAAKGKAAEIDVGMIQLKAQELGADEKARELREQGAGFLRGVAKGAAR